MNIRKEKSTGREATQREAESFYGSQLYETGATSHAVNDLILFTDNTRELAELRDKIYSDYKEGTTIPLWQFRNKLFPLSVALYKKEFPNFYDHQHIVSEAETHGIHKGTFTVEQMEEFCRLYVNDFENWKRENLNLPL